MNDRKRNANDSKPARSYKHTPGPWQAYSCEAGASGGAIITDYFPHGDSYTDGEEKPVCYVRESFKLRSTDKRKLPRYVHSEEDAANARLIAAAPEMFDLLQTIVNTMDFTDGDVIAAGVVEVDVDDIRAAQDLLNRIKE